MKNIETEQRLEVVSSEAVPPRARLAPSTPTVDDLDIVGARRRVAELEAHLVKVEHHLAVERWRTRARDERRYRRAMLLFEGAASWRDWLLLPWRLLQVLMERRPIPPRPALPRSDESSALALDVHMKEVTEAFNNGVDAPALELATQMEELAAHDAAAWRFVKAIFIRSGEITRHLRVLRRRLAAGQTWLRQAEAKELGRHRELDTRWFPSLPGSDTFVPVPKRVLHVIKESAPYLTNGYTMRSAYTVAAQKAAGLDPLVITSLGFPRSVLSDVAAKDLAPSEVMGVRHYRLDLGPTYPYKSVPWDQEIEDALVAAQGIVERERPVVIQAGSGFRGIETALLGLALARRYGIPFVYEVRSFLEHTWTGELERSERGEHFQRRSRREIQLMLEADHVITIAESMKADLVSRGVPSEHISVVPNGVDTNVFVPRPAEPALRTSIGLPYDVPVVGYVSNLGKREGIDVLIDAILDLRAKGRSVVGLVVGEGPMREDLAQQLADAGDPEAVLLPGRVPHEAIQDYYALMDVFVIPRLPDRAARLVTPLKPFEAMALQRPMVVSDLPALREIVAPSERGYVFSPGDPYDLSRVIASLLDDPSERARIGRAGREWVEEERQWNLNGPRYRKVFEGVLSRMG